MDLDGGLTPIDTLYEWSGLVLAERFADTLLWSRLFVGILVAAALLRLLYLSQKKQSYFDLAAYPVYLAFMLFLVAPVTVTVKPKNTVYGGLWEGMDESKLAWAGGEARGRSDFQVRVPRLLGVVHKITDGLLRHFTGGMGERVGLTLYRWQSVVAGFKEASILDAALSRRFHSFLEYCYWPARAARGPRDAGGTEAAEGTDLPLRERDPAIYAGLELPLGDASDERGDCIIERNLLERDLRAQLGSHPVHAEALRAAKEALGPDAAAPQEAYLTRLLYNETYGGASRGEMALLKEAVPAYSRWEQQYLGTAKVGSLSQGVSGLLGLLASFWEGSSQETLGPTLYYRMTLFAPYLYGLLQAVLLMAFPIAGLWSLWPGSWTAIFHFFKLWISIKIWPIFWSFLSAFNVYRLELSPEDPLGAEASGGSAAMFASVAAMYVLVPVLSYMILNLVSQAGMLTISAFTGAGTGAGPAVGSLVSAASVAGRAGAAVGGLAGASRGPT